MAPSMSVLTRFDCILCLISLRFEVVGARENGRASASEYCRFFAQKKAYQGEGGGSRALQDPPSYAPVGAIVFCV